MSGRATKWIVVVVLPLVLALMVTYPPTDTLKRTVTVTEKRVTDQEEAEARDLAVGDWYRVDSDTESQFVLPSLSEVYEETSTTRVDPDTRKTTTETYVAGRVNTGLDISGGSELLYRLRPRRGQTVTASSVRQIIDVLRARIDPDNIKEYVIQPVGEDRILIAVPGRTTAEVNRLKSQLERMGELEFRLAPTPQTHPALYEKMRAQNKQPGDIIEDTDGTPYRVWAEPLEGAQTGPRILIRADEPQLTGEYLDTVSAARDDRRQPAVGFRMNARGSAIFANLTETHQDWRLAIILDGQLQSAPSIDERISGSGIIRGGFSEAERDELINILQAGSLPIDIELLQENTVGPQLGAESIRKGLFSLLVAGLLVLLFIGGYYLVCGMIADAALLLNLVLLIGVMAFLDAALTLPGMAGILLTVGMAVDANVLIFERIREEWAAGKALKVALRNGYERAFTTIVDANVTTLLTAMILYMVGTGPVKGFAITLSVGLLISMFTALVVTRLAFDTFIDKGWIKEFKMFQAVKSPAIGFSAIRKPAYVISAIVVLVGLVAFFARGDALYDIDFTGGSLARIALGEPMTGGEVRQLLADQGFPDAEVQGLRVAGADSDEGFRNLTVRIKGTGGQKAREEYLPMITERLVEAGIIADETGIELQSDNRTIRVVATGSVSETELRQALSQDSIYEPIVKLDRIVPAQDADEELTTGRIAVHVPEQAAQPGPRYWFDLLNGLHQSLMEEVPGLESRDIAIQSLEMDGDEAALMVLEEPLAPERIEVEMLRSGYRGIQVEPTEQEAQYRLTGNAGEIGELVEAGYERLFDVYSAEIDGSEVRVTLARKWPEMHIRSKLQARGLRDVAIVPLDMEAQKWDVMLSAENLRREMQEAFSAYARTEVEVSFTEGEREGQVIMRLTSPEGDQPQPLSLEEVKGYLSTAGLGRRLNNMIVEDGMVDPTVPRDQWTLNLRADEARDVQTRIEEAFRNPIGRFQQIGAAVAGEMKGRALLAVLFASVIIVFYVTVRFHAFKFGVAAVIALIHDVAITAGLVALADWSGAMGDVKISLASLAAFLTIIGYSLNDTIVVFDRIRENMISLGRRDVDPEVIDLSINQTLSRTLLTSLTTLMVVVVLYLFGGSVLEGLALTLIVGVVVGTYSSMFIASPILLDWEPLTACTRKTCRIVFLPITLPFKLLGNRKKNSG